MSNSASEHYDLLDQLAEEFAARFRRGERPALEEYTDRYPELADDIRELFPAMVRVEHAEGAQPGGIEEQPVTADSPAKSPPVKQIGDYRILREVGRGGMGVVYEAEQVSLGRRVALKVLPRQGSSDRMVQERFRREARAAARLHHTNIVPVFEVGQDGDVHFYAMQFIQGHGLDAVIAELRRLLDRARSESRIPVSSQGPSPRTRAELRGQGIDATTLGEGVEVSAALQYILTGRLDPGGAGLAHPGAREALLAGSRAGVLATLAGAQSESCSAGFDAVPTRSQTKSVAAGDGVGLQREYSSPPALAPSSSPSSSSAILPGGTQLSSVESGRRGFFRSLAQIGRQVASGLAYAHARGIVHRDIKPSNLLLDNEGVVWIADFGLAKGDDEGLTHTGDILGTLRYMAPERFRGDADARADVYALGMTLYELLTLHPGFESSDRLKLIERIKTEEPPRPRAVDPRISRDLETIVLKAIEKDPRARYQSAHAMAEDLGRFLADEPIRARRVGAAERYWRWARRNPAIATLGGVLTAVLVAATVSSIVAASFFKEVARSESLANSRSQLDRQDAIAALKQADYQRDAARQEREVAQRNLYYAQMHLAQQGWREHRGLPQMHQLLTSWLPQGESPDRRGWEWFYLNSLRYQNLRTLSEKVRSGAVSTVAWHAASKRLATATTDGVIRIWDVDREQTTLTLTGPGPAGCWWGTRWFAWSPDGAKLAAGFADANVHVWETGSGRELTVCRGHKSPVICIAYSANGSRLASWEENGTIKIWDADTGQSIADRPGAGAVSAGAWSPDDKLIASGHEDGTLTISDMPAGGKVVTLRGHAGPIHDLAWSPDGARLASTSQDFTARVWEVASEKMVVGPLRHGHEVTPVAWEPSGRRLATGSIDHSVKIWNATTGREELTLRGHSDTVTSLAWSPDGHLASGSEEGSVRIWSPIRDQESRVLPGHANRATAVSYSPDGRRLASGGDDGKIRIWDLVTGRLVLNIKGHDGPVVPQFGLIRTMSWSPDGERLASGGMDGTAKVWEAASGRELFAFSADHGAVWSVAWSPDGAFLAAGSADGTIRVLDGLDHTPKIHSFQAHKNRVSGLAWTPLGDRPVSDHVFGQKNGVRALAWSPLGDRLASAGFDKLVKLWDPIRGAELGSMRADQSYALGVAWSPDGKRLASGSADFAVTSWDAATGRKLSTMRGHNDWVDAVAWSPDGTRLASAGLDNTVRVWDPRTGVEALMLRGNSGMFHDVSWHPDGAQLAAAGSDGHVWVWDATLGFERDTTPRAMPFLDRKFASGTARGDDFRWAAESYILAGRIEQALPLLLTCALANPCDTILSLRVATLQAWFGKETDFAAACRRLLKQAEGTNTPTTADRAAKAYCLRPSTDAGLQVQALTLARRAVELGKHDPLLPWFQMGLGMAEYRDGQYAAAAAALAAAEHSSSDPLIEGTSRLFGAMSLFKQGRQDEARERLGEVEARMPPLPADDSKPLLDGKVPSADYLILWLAYKEARLLLQAVSSATPSAPK
jgi:WD40 repeat protein